MAVLIEYIDPVLKELINSVLESIGFTPKWYTRTCVQFDTQSAFLSLSLSVRVVWYSVSV